MHFNVTDSIIRGSEMNKTEREREREAEGTFDAVLKLQTTILLLLLRLCVYVRPKADSRSLTGLILQRVMKERSNDSFLTSISFVIFFHHFLVFSFSLHDEMCFPFLFHPAEPSNADRQKMV